MKVFVENVSGFLVRSKIKPSYSRIRILEYLVEKDNHPTADQIYSDLVKEMPTLSKTTVYNTLKLFVEEGIARVVTIEENEARYDADIGDHGHFKCERCGNIYDFFIKEEDQEIIELSDFQIREKHVYYRGICRQCILNNKEE